MRISLVFALFILTAGVVQGATIQGDVYYYDLTPMEKVKIDINTTPHQQIVAYDGSYSLEVPPGKYLVEAKKYGIETVVASTTETVEVSTDGIFIMDLILFPTLADEQELLEGTILDVDDIVEEETTSGLAYVLTAGIILMFAFILYYTWQARKTLKETEQPSELDELFSLEKKVLHFIKKSGGRTTQKDIRKQFPLSEAKISLVLSGLEVDGKLEKMKVGRGNIIKIKK